LPKRTDIPVYVNRTTSLLLLLLFCLAGSAAQAATGRVVKVLPHLLNLEGKHSLSPSLYERDAHQAYLRQNPQQVGGMRYDVHYKIRGGQFGSLRLKVELRGIAQGQLPRQVVLEQEVRATGWFGRWAEVPFQGQAYRDFGTVTAWRVTLWEGDQLLSEQASFLW
jgi:hypothetical protein